MTGTIMQQNIIKKFNKDLDINNNNGQDIVDWIKVKSLETNTTKVKIQLKDYIDFIQRLNNTLNETDRCVRYNFAVSIQQELEKLGLEVRVCTSCLKIML